MQPQFVFKTWERCRVIVIGIISRVLRVHGAKSRNYQDKILAFLAYAIYGKPTISTLPLDTRKTIFSNHILHSRRTSLSHCQEKSDENYVNPRLCYSHTSNQFELLTFWRLNDAIKNVEKTIRTFHPDSWNNGTIISPKIKNPRIVE